MKTFGFSFFILYAFGTTEAKRLRGLLAALEIYDQREHNTPPPDYLPVLPPTEGAPKFHSPTENSFLPTNHNEQPTQEPQPKSTRHPQIGNNRW